MIEIGDLLGKWSYLLVSSEAKTEQLRNIIGEIIGIKIKPEDISIKNNVLHLNIRPIYRSEILMKREEILFKLRESLGAKCPSDIR
jgi:hypothetical protein